MKFTVNVDCTPQEARQFFGLPDVGPLQEEMMREMQNRIKANMNAMDPEAMMRMWFPQSVQSFGEVQKMIWDQMTSMMPTGSASSETKTRRKG